jgi:hypothetical protein
MISEKKKESKLFTEDLSCHVIWLSKIEVKKKWIVEREKHWIQFILYILAQM